MAQGDALGFLMAPDVRLGGNVGTGRGPAWGRAVRNGVPLLVVGVGVLVEVELAGDGPGSLRGEHRSSVGHGAVDDAVGGVDAGGAATQLEPVMEPGDGHVRAEDSGLEPEGLRVARGVPVAVQDKLRAGGGSGRGVEGVCMSAPFNGWSAPGDGHRCGMDTDAARPNPHKPTMPGMTSKATTSCVGHHLQDRWAPRSALHRRRPPAHPPPWRGYSRAVNNLSLLALVAAFATGKNLVDEAAARAAAREVVGC